VGKQGELSLPHRILPKLLLINPSTSDTYDPVSAVNQQGRIFVDQGTESAYQGGSRGGKLGVDSSASNVVIVNNNIII
jgi:hypothetical protein